MEQGEESAPPDKRLTKRRRGEEDRWDRVGNVIRAILALISLVVFVAITVSEQNPVFLIFGIVIAAIFLRFGKGRRRGRHGGDGGGDYDSDNNENGGWFGGDGGWDDGNGGGGNGGGGGD